VPDVFLEGVAAEEFLGVLPNLVTFLEQLGAQLAGE